MLISYARVSTDDQTLDLQSDALVVWRDRLGRLLKDLIARAEALRVQGVGLRSLKEAIDTDSGSGRLIFHIFGAQGEFERALIRERSKAGLHAAPARGRRDGRLSASRYASAPTRWSCIGRAGTR